jgi:hypothetical protein
MPSIINASSSGSGGLVQTADASGVLELQSNGTLAVTIDTSRRVGISTASPEASLQVNGTNGQIILSAGNAPSSGASTNKWRVGLRELVEGDFNILHFNGTSYDNIVNIGPAGQARFINTIGVGNTGGSASGAGITFPASQSASSNANTLDDYEEGTWTATASPSSSGSITFDGDNTLFYTKVGRIVTVSGRLDVQSVSSPTGELRVTLPFTVSNSGQTASSSCSCFIWAATGSATQAGLWVSWVDPNAAFAYFRYGDVSTPGGNAAQYITSGSEIRFNITYVAA